MSYIKTPEMSTHKTQLKYLTQYKKNPFLEKIDATLSPTSSAFICNDKAVIDDDVNGKPLLTGIKRTVDDHEFLKVLLRELEIICDLSKCAQKVFAYMISNCQYYDHFIFNMKECLMTTKYRSKTQVFKALTELIEKNFIAKTKNQHVFWINPKLFYTGDQIIIVRSYRKIQKQSKT